MFLPPEQRQPGLPEPPPRKRAWTRREETVATWVAAFVLVTLLVAPIGGGTILQALWYLLRR